MNTTLKYQLVGASVLVALAVIFLPYVLDGEGSLKGRARAVPIPVPPAEKFQPVEDIVPFEAAEPIPAETSMAAPEHVSETFVKPGDAVLPPAEGRLASWVVQVASLSERDKAEALQMRLRANGFAAFVETGEANGRVTYRVKVGPMALKATAEETKVAIASDFALQGMVISYP